MLPCGWASWSHKFLKYYDGYLETLSKVDIRQLKKFYLPKALYYTMKSHWMGEYIRMQNGDRASSWDYQMDFSIKANALYGICPTKNQIRNIGVDDYSIHGGNTKKKTMTDRFCDKKTYPLSFPLSGPEKISTDYVFEKKLGCIILPPLKDRLISYILKIIRKIFAIPYNQTTTAYFKNKIKL